jgi:DNA repair photolyase
VISASRRIEMPGFFPEQLAARLQMRCPPDSVHTVVLWSKHPRNIIEHAVLRKCLQRYRQVFLHLTVTGMGGSFLEPNIPATDDVLEILPALADFLGNPARLRLRFDPIVRLRLPDGKIFSNFGDFERVASAAGSAGVETMVTSRMEAYPKVLKRLRASGISPIALSRAEWKEESDRLVSRAAEFGVGLIGCCAEGWPASACVDGPLLNRLHPDGEKASVRKAQGQRTGCGCTESWDIGWYYRCPGGCLYCYANPAVGDHRQ